MKSKKFETLEVKFGTIGNKFDAVQADLQNAIRVVENKADEAIEISKQYQGVKNVRFSENLACLVFLLPPF